MGFGSGIRDPGSGKNLFRISDPGSRGQKGTGSRIRNTAYKKCFAGIEAASEGTPASLREGCVGL